MTIVPVGAVYVPVPPNIKTTQVYSWNAAIQRQFTTKNVGNNHENHRESISLQPRTIKPKPNARARAHFIQPGIFKPR